MVQLAFSSFKMDIDFSTFFSHIIHLYIYIYIYNKALKAIGVHYIAIGQSPRSKHFQIHANWDYPSGGKNLTLSDNFVIRSSRQMCVRLKLECSWRYILNTYTGWAFNVVCVAPAFNTWYHSLFINAHMSNMFFTLNRLILHRLLLKSELPVHILVCILENGWT